MPFVTLTVVFGLTTVIAGGLAFRFYKQLANEKAGLEGKIQEALDYLQSDFSKDLENEKLKIEKHFLGKHIQYLEDNNHKLTYWDSKSEHESKIKSLEDKLKPYEDKKQLDSALIGAEFEEWCRNVITKTTKAYFCHSIHHNQAIKDEHAKTNRIDILVNFYSKPQREPGAVVNFSVCIECKTKMEGKTGNKIKDALPQLFKYASRVKAKYAILVTTLEEKEDDLTCEKYHDEDKTHDFDTYICRPQYLEILIYFFTLINNEIIKHNKDGANLDSLCNLTNNLKNFCEYSPKAFASWLKLLNKCSIACQQATTKNEIIASCIKELFQKLSEITDHTNGILDSKAYQDGKKTESLLSSQQTPTSPSSDDLDNSKTTEVKEIEDPSSDDLDNSKTTEVKEIEDPSSDDPDNLKTTQAKKIKK